MTSLLTARRTLAAVATAPLLLIGLAACSDDSGGESDATASEASQSATGPDVEPGETVEPAEFVDLLGSGFSKITTAHVSFDGDLGGNGSMTGEGEVDYSGDTPAVAMTMSSELLGADDAEIRLVDGVMYMNIGQLSQDKFWKLDLDDPRSPFGALGSQLDPKSSVEHLEKGLQSVTYVGEEGALDHYTATVDPQPILGEMGPMGSAAPSFPKTFDYEIWLDDENRLNKLTFEMGDLGSTEMAMSDFGADVTVEAPPAEDVIEMPGVFSSPSTDPQG